MMKDRIFLCGFHQETASFNPVLTTKEMYMVRSTGCGQELLDNIRPGGDVYLDGRVVGQVISDMQGNQYRALQRSGWQA